MADKEEKIHDASLGHSNVFVPIADLIKANPLINQAAQKTSQESRATQKDEKDKNETPTKKWNDNKDARTIFDSHISERAYVDITKKVANASIQQLHRQFHSKNLLKISFGKFFMWFIAAQYFVLVLLFAVKAFFAPNFSDSIILTYMTSVFVETLGALVIMIVHAFDSKEEVQILNILNKVFSSFQK